MLPLNLIFVQLFKQEIEPIYIHKVIAEKKWKVPFNWELCFKIDEGSFFFLYLNKLKALSVH